MLKALAGEESTRISTGDECVNCQDSVKLLTDLTDSNTSTEDTQCLKPVPVSQGKYSNVLKYEDDNTCVIDNTGYACTDGIQEHKPEDDNTRVIDNTGYACTNGIPQQEPENHDTLVIEKIGPMNTNGIQEYKPEGDSLISNSFFHKEQKRAFVEHNRGFMCNYEDWMLVNVRRYGFKTQFFYKCNMCNYKTSIWSHPRDNTRMDINTAIIAGTITTGIGYGQMEKMFAVANVPSMSEKTYIKYLS